MNKTKLAEVATLIVKEATCVVQDLQMVKSFVTMVTTKVMEPVFGHSYS